MDWAQPLNRKARFLAQLSPCGICGNWTGLSPSTSVYPVSIFSPMLHTHPFILTTTLQGIATKTGGFKEWLTGIILEIDDILQ
jgi:hypothetical protein